MCEMCKNLKIVMTEINNHVVDFVLLCFIGAGSVLEVLQAGKPLIVVINELLMDNHQLELASQLSEEGHLYYATCRCCTYCKLDKALSDYGSVAYKAKAYGLLTHGP